MTLFPSRGAQQVTFVDERRAKVQDRTGRVEYSVVKQGGKEIVLDQAGRRLGYVDGQGVTFDHAGHILARNPRIDLILQEFR